jgi:DNA-binding transcriptional regulator YiaG
MVRMNRASNELVAVMLADELLELLRQLDLNQVAAARLVGVNGRTMRRWTLGESEIPPPAAQFLRYLARAKVSPVKVMKTLAS